MIAALSSFALFALEGHWAGIRAILVVVALFVVLAGSIYLLLWSNLGAKVAWHVLMVSFAGYMIVMSLIWLVGAPGTAAGTGPRAGQPSNSILVATEPHWVPFLADSEQGREFAEQIAEFPNGWDELPPQVEGSEPLIYPGNVDARGEFDTLRTVVTGALARLAEKQELAATDPKDWSFRPEGPAATPDEEKLPVATVRFKYEKGSPLLFAASIPASKGHRAVTVFAFRDKGRVFLYSLYFLIASVVLFIFHALMLARIERKEIESAPDREVQLV
ncbi:MAG TPA: hypothetical protein VM600_07960 [Actinomycetota bacterium]|nr:hypothetical protein [Actinomycetota bacterium]